MSTVESFEAMLTKGMDGDMLRFSLGNAYWKQQNFNAAITHLQKAVEFNNDYSAAWKTLGRVLVDADRLDEASVAYLSGLEAAERKGDKQTAKEITVFIKRLNKLLQASRTGTATSNTSVDESETQDGSGDGRDDVSD